MKTRIANVERGVKVNSEYEFLQRYCQNWLKRMRQYHTELRDYDDWPFWYGERPLIGFLAAGIWASNGICIEEYQADKKSGSAEGAPKPYLGRGDLYFIHSDKCDGNVEFKMRNIGISKTRDYGKTIKKHWRASKDDARKIPYRGVPRFGGIFLRPYVGSSKDAASYKANLKELLRSAWALRPDALAWWCPVDEVIGGKENTKDWVVGVVMLIKKI